MRKLQYTLLLLLLAGLFTSTHAYNGQSNINFLINSRGSEKYFVDFSVDFIAPQSISLDPDHAKFTVFIWPGLQPDGPERKCFYPINNGVLQPVLTFGNSCAPDKPADVEQWWISGQYVNTDLDCKSVPDEFLSVCKDYFDCHGGQFVEVIPGNEIKTNMKYNPGDKSWMETIETDGLTRTYSIALDYCSEDSKHSTPVTREPQSQTNAILSIETDNYDFPLEQTFTNIVLKIHVGDDGSATCNNTLSMKETVSASSCTPLEMISNSDGVLTCQVASCTVHKPTELPTFVPTLTEYGLLAIAVLLGITGFLVLRRRKAVV